MAGLRIPRQAIEGEEIEGDHKPGNYPGHGDPQRPGEWVESRLGQRWNVSLRSSWFLRLAAEGLREVVIRIIMTIEGTEDLLSTATISTTMTMTEAEDPVEVKEGVVVGVEGVEEGEHMVEEVAVGMEGGMGARVTEVTTTTAGRERRNVTPDWPTNTVERSFGLSLSQIVR